MGSAIAQGLLEAGYEVVVQNRTGENTELVAALGALVVDSPARAIQLADATFLVLADSASTRAILDARGVPTALEGHALLNVAATTPEEIAGLARQVYAAGGHLAEVKITTHPDTIRERHGEFILACDQAHTALWRTVLGALGEKIHHVGPVGNASKADMALRLPHMFRAIAAGYAVAAFAKQGLPINVLELVLMENPFLKTACTGKLIEGMKDRAYGTQLCTVDEMINSCDLLIDFAEKLGLPLEALAASKSLYTAAAERGFGNKDITAVYEAINPSQLTRAS
jgi:3-hydroxyisobutyrate dehydrogenase-like beta-hydroxyacid dehydrogenase